MVTQIDNVSAAGQGQFLRRAEWVFAIGALSLLVGATRIVFSGNNLGAYSIAGAIEGNFAYQVAMGAVYVFALAMLFNNRQKVAYLCQQNLSLLLFVIFVAASPLWSELPNLGMRRSFAFTGNVILAFYLVTRFSPREFLEILGWVFAITLLVDVAVIVALPSVGIDFRRGALVGAHGHKNDFGQMMVLGAAVYWVLKSKPGWLGILAWGGFILCVALACLTLSRSAWLVLAGLFVVGLPLIRSLQNPTLAPSLRMLWVAVFGVGSFLLFLLEFYGAGLESIGKDVTLTNRTLIWNRAIELGWSQPWLGAGFGTFWESSLGKIFAEKGREIGHAHNGFVEMWLQLGFVGLGLFLFVLLNTSLRVLRQILRFRDGFTLFLGLFVLYVLTYSIVVKIMPDHRRVVWVIFVAGMLYAGVSSKSLMTQSDEPEPQLPSLN